MTREHETVDAVLIRKTSRAVNSVLSSMETLFASKASEAAISRHPPVFILGAPRSGSTLLYQLMTEYFNIGFISNLLCGFWGAPSWIQSISGPVRQTSSSDFSSDYGRTTGKAAPSECGEYWYRFFRRSPQHVPLAEADPESMRRLRRAVGNLTAAFGRTVLFKNLMNSVRIQPLAHSLPEALFIVVERDEVSNAYSILKGRYKALGNYDNWWSLEPPNVESLRHLSAAAQAVEQVRKTYECIDSDARAIGLDKFLYIQYEELCDDVPKQLSRIEEFLSRHQVQLGAGNRVPSTFKRSVLSDPDDGMYKDIENYVNSANRNDDR